MSDSLCLAESDEGDYEKIMIRKNLRTLDVLIRKYGLRPATERPLSLFTLSCVAYGYTKLLRKMIGISAHAVGGLGSNDRWHSMLNERAIIEETQQLIHRHAGELEEKIFAPTQKLLKILTKKIYASKKLLSHPEVFLKIMTELQPQYMACIGVYNCFWRFIGDGTNISKLTKKQIEKISRERNTIATMYPKVEKWIEKAGVLRYCTRAEILQSRFTASHTRARKKYFYLYTEHDDCERVVTDRTIVHAIEKKYYRVDVKNAREVRGQSAFIGVVRGTIFNAIVGVAVKRHIPKDMILVTSMTHPDDIALVRKARAIVTDEGGILCHAAIIAREMKKPCIIGTKIATKVFKDGDRVEVDAELGIVRKI